jgi:hypothetical protein
MTCRYKLGSDDSNPIDLGCSIKEPGIVIGTAKAFQTAAAAVALSRE